MASREQRQKVHNAILRYFVKTGRAPHYTELAKEIGVAPGAARKLIHETTADSPFSFAWVTPDTDFIGAWAPFSNLPNQHAITVDGAQKWYGQ